jgi:LacI family transcriptional regulator
VDVAKRAGVSVTTVSRVINDSPHPVKQNTRQRVLQAAEELNFVPSALARALVSDYTKIIGVIVGDASDPYFATIVRGISDVAREKGYLTMICNSDRIPDVELSYVHMMRDYHTDGIIFAGGGLNDESYMREMGELISRLRVRHTPVVSLGSHLFESPQINIDNTRAAADMTGYLVGLGHSRIAFIDGPELLTTTALRRDGYKQALKKHGIPYDPDLVVSSNFTYDSGQEATDILLTRDPQPTAIFGSNDLVAIGCLARLRERGISVPDQISVAGFDDIFAARYVNPPLTTIQVPMWKMGAIGMQKLVQMIQTTDKVEDVTLLEHSLVVRASCAPLRHAD